MEIILSSLVVIIGWVITHCFSLMRSAKDKKREVTIEYLINAWRTLESASNRSDTSYNAKLETAIADIQLLGTQKQIELAQQFADQMAQTGSGDALELLIQLREDLRKELSLEVAKRNLKIFRLGVRSRANETRRR